jgi:phenylacetate-CoA ligase
MEQAMSGADPVRRLADFGRALVVSRTVLARTDRLDVAARLRFQQQRLEQLVRHAVERSPFYRDHYRGIDLDRVDLAALPPVAKSNLVARFDDWVTDRRLKLADLDRHVQNLARDERYLGHYRVMATSGSTGGRAVFVYGGADWRTSLANFARLNESYLDVHPRIPRRLRVAGVGTTSPIHISTRTSLSAAVGINRVLRLDARRPVGELAAALDEFRPEFLVGYPSILSLLAHEQGAGRLRIRPLTVATVSEVRTREMADAIRRAWDVEPFDWYGITEGGVLAGDCRHHQGMHLFEDLFIVENVDGDGKPVADGEVGNKLLLTNLFNRTQPLIRYELSDMVALDSQPCPCGRLTRRVISIEGRNDDILLFPALQGGQIPIHPIVLRRAFAALPAVRQYKVVLHDSGLSVLLVIGDGPAIEETTLHIRAALAAGLGDAGAISPEIVVEAVPHLPRDRGHGAKFKLIESRRGALGPAAEGAACD